MHMCYLTHLSPSDICCYIPDDVMVHCLATDTITVDSAGYTYNNDCHKFSIQFPEGAIPLNKKVIVSIGIMLHGPFIFPGGMKPVSPIYWICCHPEVELLKPVKFRLPHFVNCEGRKPGETPIVFAKALRDQHSNGKHIKRVYAFTKIDQAVVVCDRYAEFETDHFCFTCLMEPTTDKNAKHSFCCIPIVDAQESKILLVVTYLLPTCIEVTC